MWIMLTSETRRKRRDQGWILCVGTASELDDSRRRRLSLFVVAGSHEAAWATPVRYLWSRHHLRFSGQCRLRSLTRAQPPGSTNAATAILIRSPITKTSAP